MEKPREEKLAVFSFERYPEVMKWKLLALLFFVFLGGFTYKEKIAFATVITSSQVTIGTSGTVTYETSFGNSLCSGNTYIETMAGSGQGQMTCPILTSTNLLEVIAGGSGDGVYNVGVVANNTGAGCTPILSCPFTFQAIRSGGLWYYGSAPPNFNTHFDSISVSTTTNKLNVQGYWQASSTILVTQSTENATYALNVYPTTFGGSGFTNSSSTGNFNLDFRIFQQGCVSETSSTTICTTDQIYTYQAVLYDGHYPSQQYPYKDSTSTQLTYPYQGTSTIFVSDFTNQFYNATLGTSTLLSSTNMLSFLNVPRLLQERIPFAYIFQIANGINEGISSSSTTAIPSGNFIWKNTQNGTTTFDMFSPATIKVYMSDSIIALWRAFLLVVLTINFGYALYYETKRHHII